MLESILDAFGCERLALEGIDLADCLYIAAYRNKYEDISARDRSSEAPLYKGKDEEVRKVDQKDIQGVKKSPGEPHGRKEHQTTPLLPPSTMQGERGPAGSLVRTPGAAHLGNSLTITKEIRPLFQKRRSIANTEIDIEATARSIAETGICSPVYRPSLESWLEIDIVVERSASMSVWEGNVRELLRIFETQSGNRKVSSWSMIVDYSGGIEIRKGSSSQKRSAKEVSSGGANKLILLISDCVSPLWKTSELNEILKDWGSRRTVFILQTLPQNLWRRSHLGRCIHASAQSGIELRKNKSISPKSLSPWQKQNNSEAIYTPLTALLPESLGDCVSYVLGDGRTNVPIFGMSSDTSRPASDTKSPEELFRQFYENASPTAFRLATCLAATPLHLPIMELIQHVMMPGSNHSHLAEFFLSGLLKRSELKDDSKEVIFEFIENKIRNKLLSAGSISETLQVLECVSKHISESQGTNFDFLSVAANGDSRSQVSGTCISDSFARLSSEIVEKIGLRNQNSLRSSGSSETDRIIESGISNQIVDDGSAPPRRDVRSIIAKAWELERGGELLRSIEILEDYASELDAIGDYNSLLRVTEAMVVQQEERANFLGAIRSLERLLQSSRHVQDRHQEMTCLGRMAALAHLISDFDKAIMLNEEAIKIARELQIPRQIDSFVAQLTRSLAATGLVSQAIEMAEKTIRKYHHFASATSSALEELLKKIRSQDEAVSASRSGESKSERVFISYTQESEEHLARVTALVRALQNAGFTVSFDGDQPAGGPNLGWPIWSGNESENAPRVLAVFTETYRKCWQGHHPPGVRDGATWEAMALANRCYGGGAGIKFLRPVVFEQNDSQHIPARLKGLTRFHGENDIESIIAWLHGEHTTLEPTKADEEPTEIPPNTFRIGTPATGEYFVGRTQEIRDLHVMLEKGQGTSLLGDSCIGKSSLLLKWQELAQAEGHRANIVDFQTSAATHRNFLTLATGGDISGTEELDADTTADRLLAWAAELDKKPLILVDESEGMIRDLDYRFFERLRGMASQIILVFVSRTQLSEVFQDTHGKTSPFINLLETTKLGLLKENEAQTLADRAGEHAGLLRLWAGQHPYYLQCLGSQLERIKGESTTDNALNRFRNTAYQRLEEIVSRYGPKAQKALAEASEGTLVNHYELKAKGLLNANGRPFGRILAKWMEDRE